MSVTWSYSALNAFETCPRRYYLTKISKQVKEPQSAEMSEGNAVHKALELHIKGTQYLPDEYKKWLPAVEMVKNASGEVMAERKFALTQNFEETTYFAKDVWMRGVFDVAILNGNKAAIIDWKTGKRKFDADQLKLFAASAFKLWPHVTEVNTSFVWLKEGKADNDKFVADDSPKLWREFSIRVERMEVAADTQNYPPRPSGLCRGWCPVGKALCEHCES